MNQKIQKILDIFQKTENLRTEEKDSVLIALRDTNKELEITTIKLEKTEEERKTKAILLEETIKELEQKRKAVEARNRELEIEESLERVRAVAMSMMKSEDLIDVCKVMLTALNTLGFENIRNTQIDILNDDKECFLNYLYSDYGVNGVTEVIYDSHPIVTRFVNDVRSAPDALSYKKVTGRELDEWREHRKKNNHLPDAELEQATSLYYYCYSIGTGALGISSFEAINEEKLEVLKRFRNVFKLSYQRYKDIEHAEAQAREAQIEAALERVRARTMAMQKSEELAETATILFEQLNALGELPDRIGICIINEEQKVFEQWITNQEGIYLGHRVNVSIEESTTMAKLYNAWKAKKDHLVIDLQGQELKNWMRFVREEIKIFIDDTNIKGQRIHNGVFFSNGMFLCTTHEPINNEIIQLLIRFVKVFDQTYTRFLDLQKAEAQAREAQIEGALERVRSKTMAMHNSHDMGITVVTLFDEVLKLGLDNDIRCGIGILEGTERMETRSTTSYPTGEVDLKMGMLDMTIHPLLVRIKKAWKSGGTRYTDQMTGKDVIRYYTALNNEPDYPFFVDLDTLPEIEYHNSFSFSEGILFAFSPNLMSDEAAKVFDRFARVFGQTYRRYRDLQKAEEQAREAKIEASLERVRAKAMAMHKSDDLTSSVATVFSELDRLGLRTVRCGIGIFNDQSKKVDVWTTSSNNKSDSMHLSGDEVLEGHPLLEGIFEAWKHQKDYSYVLQGQDLLDYYRVTADSNLPVSAPEVKSKTIIQYYHCIMFPAGGLFAFQESEFSTEAKNLMRRFADVFQLTFTRHLDLRQAEAQNKIIQVENERKTMELEEARQLQLSMLPKELPQLPNLDIAVHMQTATEVGGDYYDFQVGIDGTLTTVIGDATGHGMKAGTVVTITKSLFNSMATNENILGTFDKISQVIRGMKFRQLAMCLLMMKIKGNRLLVSSAAMPPALIYREKNKTVEEIFLKGMPLGTMKKFPYKKIEGRLNSGDRILLYSDGLSELANDKDQMFGYDRIKTEFQLVGEKEPEQIVDHLKNSASQWVNGKDPDDDVTFVVLKMK